MNPTLFEKYVHNCCTPQELEEVQQWINAPENKEEVLDMFNRYWETMPENEEEKTLDSQRLFDSILSSIDVPYIETKPSIFIKQKTVSQKRKRDWGIVSKYAAVILLMIVSVFVFYTINQETIPQKQEVAQQETIIRKKSPVRQLQLSDGSKVWLNAGSSLKYPDSFSGSLREVYLEGEAFFDVVKNPDKPFIVKTTGFTIKVVGTSFNVKSYKQDETIETALATGKIFIEKPASAHNKEQILILQPSQGAVFYKKTQAIEKIEQIDVQTNIAWKEGILAFKNAPFEQVVTALERWYGVDIVHKNVSTRDFRLTANFEKESLNEVLAIINLTLPITYTIEENKVIIL